MLGYNVLHPQSFHCTGLPILGAAKRIAEREPAIWGRLRQMGIPEREIPKFEDPMHWIEVVPAGTMGDLKALGAAVDWTRSFITTPLNPPYDAFVRWQFLHLKAGGYVKIDKHPVIWCPKDQAPIGDHDRLEGEGETPMEYTLLKFPLADGRFLVAATIRPETVFGQTNLWVDPEVTYVVAQVGDERWIVNALAAKKLAEQGKSVAAEARIPGTELIGRDAVAPAINRAIPILPSSFIDQGRGTGIVTSVPSDAPDDYVALRDLQQDDAQLAKYGLDAEAAWKGQVHEAMASMELHPEALRKWFDYVTDWLHEWTCTHHRGLGTILPWDSNWVIESLSDSTIYMAYYTIAHALQGGALRSHVPWAQRLDDAFFDYVFLGKGSPRAVASRLGLEVEVIEGLRQEFAYWYPVDLRNTGKDLVQNHMTFCLFVHAAVFPKELWPRGYGVNGWVRLEGRKMSKSKGNVWYIRDAVREWGADPVRMAVANAGDGLDDPNLDLEFAATATARLRDWFRFATGRPRSRQERHGIDAWFLSVLNRAIQATRASMEEMNYKTALRHGYFDIQSAWSWYLRRSEGHPRAEVLRRLIEVQTKLLAPFAQ